MISDASKWVDINIDNWHYVSPNVTQITGGYALNGASISASITLSGNQIADQFGIIFTISGLQEMQYNPNYCQLTFYDENGSLTDAGIAYLPISEDGGVWTEVEASKKTYKVVIDFCGDFNVTGMQIYAVNDNVNVSPATTEVTGIVRPVITGGLKVVEADVKDGNGNVTAKAGDLSVNVGDGINITEDGKLSTTSDVSGNNLQSVKFYTATGDQGMAVNGCYFFAKVNGGMKYLNGNRVISVTADTSGVAAAWAAYVAAKQAAQQAEGGGNGGS